MILGRQHRCSHERSENESNRNRKREGDGGAVLRPNEDEPANEQSEKRERHCESGQFVGDPTSTEHGGDDGVEHGYEPEGGGYVVGAFFGSLFLGVGGSREGE
jgi:hypothetical protein